MAPLIINADDFGMGPAVNRGVVEAFQRGFCSSATLMATLPGFEEACELIHREKLANCVGLHLVLRDGVPLTEPIRRLPRFCDAEGRFILARRGPLPILYFSGPERHALAAEIRAQINRCRRGEIPLTHLDSHYDLHTEWAVAGVVLQVVREEKIPYVRIARNFGPHLNVVKRLYKAALNRRLVRAGAARTRLFGSVRDYQTLRQPPEAADWMEIMIHPRFCPDGVLRDDSNQQPLEASVQCIQGYQEAVSFGGHRWR
ncbi:MAG: ChbG/HpnK family deacetylase [Candidatus Omnitrophota bacterium]|nr:ChbG/HpnK family deacetylase [Candidatus Omnitrophota bacterium]